MYSQEAEVKWMAVRIKNLKAHNNGNTIQSALGLNSDSCILRYFLLLPVDQAWCKLLGTQQQAEQPYLQPWLNWWKTSWSGHRGVRKLFLIRKLSTRAHPGAQGVYRVTYRSWLLGITKPNSGFKVQPPLTKIECLGTHILNIFHPWNQNTTSYTSHFWAC